MNKPQTKICPYLGKSKTNPNQMLCGKLKPPSPIRTSYIKEYCLADYEACSIYQGAPGRQSADEKSPLVVVPIAPAQRDNVLKSDSGLSTKAPNVEFLAYQPPQDEVVKQSISWLWLGGVAVGIIVIFVLVLLIVTHLL